ncbi:MAG TPA: SDR family NAD(P)-dependent oxidoreductase [Thermomicrobiales bacterium]|nr:SDR family NAD(P)-dependent oxidoreductase [Thermomicrobiales bacterium]
MSESTILAGKIAIITGAGTGVGRATALAVAGEGVSPVLVGRRRDPLEQTAELVASRGGTALVAPADVADEVAVADVVARTVAELGGVDILVNAAAVGLYGPVERYPLQAWQQTMATNLTGVFLFCRAVLPSMKSRGGGAIIAIGSGAGKQGYADLAAYSASKFGLMGFMQSLAGEVDDDRIKVSTILPGSILTDFGGRSVAEKQTAIATGKRFINPDDVAEAILFLLRQPAHAWTQELNLWPF